MVPLARKNNCLLPTNRVCIVFVDSIHHAQQTLHKHIKNHKDDRKIIETKLV